jgi:hypothetical protein
MRCILEETHDGHAYADVLRVNGSLRGPLCLFWTDGLEAASWP